MNGVDAVWVVGRMTIQPLTKLFAPLRNYGSERVPMEGGVVLAMNHFSWLDPPAFGTVCPRTIHFLAKSEIHSHFGLGQLIRAFGTRSVRRGESDREAVRAMREIVRDGQRARPLRRGNAAEERLARARRCPARPWSRSRRTSRSSRPRSTGASSGSSATSIRSRSPGASRCASRGSPARARGTARARR